MLDTIIHEIDLNMSQPNNFQYIYAMQNDYAAEYIRCTLYDGNKLYNIKCNKGDIIAKAELPTGYEALPIVYACDLNTITLKITKDITCFGGDVKIAISLLDGDAKKSTFPFILKVTDAPAGVTAEEIEYGKQAEYYANMSKSFAVGTNNVFREGDAKDNSKYYCEEAAKSAKSIGDAEKNCAASAASAKTSADNASKSEKNAKTSETNAKTSETNSKTSETNAKNSEANSKVYAQAAESYAVGTGGYRQNEATDNSKYYYQQMKTKVDEGALAEFIYFETYSEFETEYAAGNIPANMLVVIKEHIYDKNWDNHDIIDDHLSLTSYHAVQNKVVTEEINDLKTAINNITNNVTNLEIKVTALENHKCKCEDCTNYTNVPGGTGSSGGNSGSGSTTLPEPTSSDIIWLYKEGDECTSITGGWKVNGSSTQYYKMEKLSNCLQSTCLDISPEPGLNQPSVQRDFSTAKQIQAPNDFALCVQYKFSGTNSVSNDEYSLLASSGCTFLEATPEIDKITVVYEGYNDDCHQIENNLNCNIYITPNYTKIVGTVGVIYNVWFQKRGTKILSPTISETASTSTPTEMKYYEYNTTKKPNIIWLYKEGEDCLTNSDNYMDKWTASNSWTHPECFSVSMTPYFTSTCIQTVEHKIDILEYPVMVSGSESRYATDEYKLYIQYSCSCTQVDSSYYPLIRVTWDDVVLEDSDSSGNRKIIHANKAITDQGQIRICGARVPIAGSKMTIYNVWLQKDGTSLPNLPKL